MPRRSSLCLAFLLATIPSALVADTTRDLAGIEARLKSCIDKDGSNAGMIQCSGDAHADADNLLNRVYGTLSAPMRKKDEDADMAQRNRETLKRLVAAERAWVAYRDAECSFQGTEMLGGSGENLVIVGCEYELTKERIKRLDSALKDR